MENIKELEQMMAELEEILTPNLRIKLEIGFMDKTIGAKTSIPLSVLMQEKVPGTVVDKALHQMTRGILKRLQGVFLEEMKQNEEE